MQDGLCSAGLTGETFRNGATHARSSQYERYAQADLTLPPAIAWRLLIRNAATTNKD